MTEEQRLHKREYDRKWRSANAEKAKEYARQWRAANPENKKKYNRKWRSANHEKEKESTRQWRAANPEKEKASKHKWRAANPEKEKKYNRLVVEKLTRSYVARTLALPATLLTDDLFEIKRLSIQINRRLKNVS